MAELSRDTVRLLDRLFNLRGLENVIVKGIEEEIERNNNKTTEEQDTKKKNEIAKVDCEGRLKVFETQKGIFESAFAGLDNETFSALRDIGVNIEIGTMLETITEKSPLFCAELNAQIKDYEERIDSNKARIDELNRELGELEDSKAKGIEDRSKLDSLLEQCLSADEAEREALSTSYVKKILGLFEVFSTEEINTLAKLILFPDDGLYSYAETYEDRVKNGLVNLDDVAVPEEDVASLEEAVPAAEGVYMSNEVKVKKALEDGLGEELPPVPSVPEEVHEDIKMGSELGVLDGATTLLDLNSLNRPEEVDAPAVSGQEDQKVSDSDSKVVDGAGVGEEDETILLTSNPGGEEGHDLNPALDMSVQENDGEVRPVLDLDAHDKDKDKAGEMPEEAHGESKVEEFFKRVGLDETQFVSFNKLKTLEDIYKLFENVPESVIQNNHELLRSLDVSNEAIYTCFPTEVPTYLVDTDLSKKITSLRAKGISEKVIKELLDDSISGLRNSYEIVEEKIAAIENSIGKLDDDNVRYIGTNIVLYDKNCRELTSFGIELEDQELRNNQGILSVSENVPADLKVLKSYLISLVRKNGKYALSPFWKEQYELLTDIDDLIEADLERLFEYDPEVLGQNVSEVIKRVKFCGENHIPVYDEEDKTTFNDYIVNYAKFNEKFGRPSVSLEDRENVNHRLAGVIGNEGYVEILTGILDEHYREAQDLVDVTMDTETASRFESLKALLGEKFNVTSSGKYTIKIEDVCISKNKFERQLSVLLNALVSSAQEIDGVERELLLTALLYNLRQDDETLRKVVESGLGFNVELKTLGGKSL